MQRAESLTDAALLQPLCWAQGRTAWHPLCGDKEAVVHENYKQYIIKAKDIDTRVTGRSTGHPVRVLRNQITNKYLEMEKQGATFEELESLTVGGLRRAVRKAIPRPEA